MANVVRPTSASDWDGSGSGLFEVVERQADSLRSRSSHFGLDEAWGDGICGDTDGTSDSVRKPWAMGAPNGPAGNLLGVGVNSLVITCGVAEEIDSRLIQAVPFGKAEVSAHEFLERIDSVDDFHYRMPPVSAPESVSVTPLVPTDAGSTKSSH